MNENDILLFGGPEYIEIEIDRWTETEIETDTDRGIKTDRQTHRD